MPSGEGPLASSADDSEDPEGAWRAGTRDSEMRAPGSWNKTPSEHTENP